MSRTRALVEKATDTNSTLAERHEAFDELVRLFQDMAFACAYAALGDFHLAEDAAQGAFVTAWRRLDQLREPEAFPGWLRRVVLTECNRLRRGRPRLAAPLEDGSALAARGASQQQSVESRELRELLLAAVGRLPRAERTVVALFYFDGRTHEEIARLLEVPRTTVAKRLHTARRRLKAAAEASKLGATEVAKLGATEATKAGAARAEKRGAAEKRGGATAKRGGTTARHGGTTLGQLREGFDARRPSRDEAFAARVRRGLFDAYLGRYRYEQRPDLVVHITREGDRLFGEAAGQRNELFARRADSAGALRTREFDGRGEFIRDARGRVTHFVYYEFGREMGRARKID
jgi:RNA polymerase sigma factor (sigma-70 family)